MANPGKDTIYLDVDDEITAIIDKVTSAKHKIVAVVLPKRATVFQSAVNMKLLKKSAVSAKKNLVLVTSDKSIMAIAGGVGVHVAKTPTSKPVIPAAVAAASVGDALEVESDDNDDSGVSKTKVAVAAGVAAGAAAHAMNSDDDEAIELDNTDDSTESVGGTDSKEKKKKIIRIPDFSSFKLRLGLVIGLIVLLIGLWYVGFVVMPKATVFINTNASNIPVNTVITTDVDAAEVDLETNTVPAKLVQVEKIDSLSVPATGEKNIGNNATGTITLTNCIDDGEKKVIAAGTTFSKNGLGFVTTAQVILDPALVSAGVCKSADFGLSKDAGLSAAEPGTEYNLGEGSYVSSISGILGYGGDMSGGTTDTVKVISQTDVDNATSQLSGTSKNQALGDMQQQLRDQNVRPIDETLGEGTANVVASPAVGAEAAETKVTMTITYNLTGVSDDDLSRVIDDEVNKTLGDNPQNIRDNGLSGIQFTLSSKPNEAEQKLTLETVAVVGPDINEDELKEQIAGKKRGDIEKQIEAIDGVRSVSVEYSPAWITTTPKSAEKITIVFIDEDESEN